MGVQLVTGDIARRCIEQRGDAVDDGGAGVLDGGGLHPRGTPHTRRLCVEAELRPRPGLAGPLPVAHIAIVRAVDLANGLLLHGDALHGLDGDHGRHTDAVPCRDGAAQRGAVHVVIRRVGDVLLADGLDGQPQLVADGLAGVPRIGGLELGRVGDLLLKLLGGQTAAVGLGQCQAVILYIIAVCALDAGQLVAAARRPRPPTRISSRWPP